MQYVLYDNTIETQPTEPLLDLAVLLARTMVLTVSFIRIIQRKQL
jgi:hypothetical protein